MARSAGVRTSTSSKASPRSRIALGSVAVISRTTGAAASLIWSLRRDAGLLDDRPPFVGFRLVMRTQGVGRLLVGRRNLLADVLEALPYRGIGERFARRGIELRHHVARRPLRHPEGVPDRHVEARKAGFIDGGNVRRRG